MNATDNVTVNQKHKDSLFRMIFKEKKELLSLYNALAGTNYDNPEDLEIKTDEDVIFLHMKNDISFIVDDYLNLYEHQSTFNPNMPLRGLLYMTDLYKPMVKGPRLYSAQEVKIPNPKYIVFYNGTKKMPCKLDLRLSDSFIHREKGGDVEVVAHMLNINYGQNKELMQKCKKLNEYAYFVDAIRKHLSATHNREEAAQLAIEECIKNNILKDILEKERLLIMNSILSEFDEEAYAKMLREEGYDEGYDEGVEYGMEHGKQSALITSILSFLQDLGDISEELKSKIAAEKNLEKLELWLKFSARANSLEDFRKNSGI